MFENLLYWIHFNWSCLLQSDCFGPFKSIYEESGQKDGCSWSWGWVSLSSCLIFFLSCFLYFTFECRVCYLTIGVIWKTGKKPDKLACVFVKSFILNWGIIFCLAIFNFHLTGWIYATPKMMFQEFSVLNKRSSFLTVVAYILFSVWNHYCTPLYYSHGFNNAADCKELPITF